MAIGNTSGSNVPGQFARIQRMTWITAIIWSIVVAVSLAFNLNQQELSFNQQLFGEAKAIYLMDSEFRNWVIDKGGVYVPVDQDTPPSPWLAHVPERDVATPSGNTLTLLNSSYAMRQVHELMEKTKGAMKGHISSTHPINPVNQADAWEAAAIGRFEQDEQEASGIDVMPDGNPYFRYMRPMVTEQSCLKCHAQFGSKLGDIRGGISVSLPIKELRAVETAEQRTVMFAHALFWGFGIAGLFIYGRKQREALESVIRSEGEVTLLTNSIAHAIYGLDEAGRCTFANEACVRELGYASEQELLGRDMHELAHARHADGSAYSEAECPTCRTLREGSEYRSEDEWLWRRDGTGFPVSFWAYPVQQGERLLGAVITFLDITEQKRTSEALASSTRLLDSIVEHVPAMIFLKQAGDLRFVRFNRAGEELLGYSRQDLLGKNDHDLFPEEQADAFAEDDRAVLDSHKVVDVPEEVVKTAYGHERWLHTRKVGLYDDSGEPTHLLGISIDVTVARERARMLAASQRMLSEAQRIAHLGSWELDIVDNRLEWSDEIYSMFEIDPGSLVATYERFLEAIHPDDRDMVDDAYRLSVEQHKPYELEHRLLMPDGRIKYVIERCETEYADDGTPLRSKGTALDFTGRKQAELALRESMERYDSLVRRIPVGIYTYRFNAQGASTFEYVSPRFCEILNLDAEAVLKDDRLAFAPAHPDDFESLIECNRRAFEEQRHFEWEGRFVIGGEQRWIRLESEPEVLPDGGSIWNGVLIDNTESRQAQKALGHARRALETLSTVNRELVHAQSEPEMLDAICRAIVYQHGYKVAWVGFVEPDETSVRTVASAVGSGEALPAQLISLETDSPTTRAVQTAESIVVGELPAEAGDDPLLQRLAAEGCRSLVAMPLKNREGHVFGVLHVYGARPDAFTGRELALLEEMADDSSFGVRSLRLRAERDRAMEESRQYLSTLRTNLVETIEAISKAVEARDPYTAGHQHRVAELACAIATEMGLDAERIEGIRMGGIIHDIGKIQLPAEILSKPSNLSDMEYQFIKEHSNVGYEILKDIDFPWPVALIARQHHERLDGSGYPLGLKGDEICLEARIIAVADVVEAMSSHRPYRAGLGIDTALQEIESKRGIYYDAAVTDACLRLFRERSYTIA